MGSRQSPFSPEVSRPLTFLKQTAIPQYRALPRPPRGRRSVPYHPELLHAAARGFSRNAKDTDWKAYAAMESGWRSSADIG